MAKKQPMQPIVYDDAGVIRFQKNALVCALLEYGGLDMNWLALIDASTQDQEQFAQLIGYSVSGFGDLSYVRRKTVTKADRRAARLQKKHERR